MDQKTKFTEQKDHLESKLNDLKIKQKFYENRQSEIKNLISELENELKNLKYDIYISKSGINTTAVNSLEMKIKELYDEALSIPTELTILSNIEVKLIEELKDVSSHVTHEEFMKLYETASKEMKTLEKYLDVLQPQIDKANEAVKNCKSFFKLTSSNPLRYFQNNTVLIFPLKTSFRDRFNQLSKDFDGLENDVSPLSIHQYQNRKTN